MNKHRFIWIVPLFMLAAIPCLNAQQSFELLDGESWKQQGFSEIMRPWMNNTVDSRDGQFYARMDRKWTPQGKPHKYPGMLSRHLFSYSAAYMMSGDTLYLNRADRLFQYLKEFGWDHEQGGWYYAIDREGQPVDSRKDLFMNIYAITGLSFYYMVTLHAGAKRLIDKSRDLLEKKAWDARHGGYYRRLNRRWEVTDSTKVFTPQVAPVSGYLLYLYAATRNSEYLEESRRLMELVSRHMTDSCRGWIREKFSRSWEELPDPSDSEWINIGHNIEVSWIYLRLYEATGREQYRKQALSLNRLLHRHAFRGTGAWLHKLDLDDPGSFPQTTPWWVQAYGNMMELSSWRATGDSTSLGRFRMGGEFWNDAFVDSRWGGTILSATLLGREDRGHKAVRTKTSYHAVEHALLNYLYVNLGVQNKAVALHFYRDKDSSSEPVCPLPILDRRAEIQRVSINGGNLDPVPEWKTEPCLELPAADEQQQITFELISS